MGQRLHDVESRNITFVGPEWPVFWSQALGANVADADGNIYIDLTSAFGVALLGHANDLVVRHKVGDMDPPLLAEYRETATRHVL